MKLTATPIGDVHVTLGHPGGGKGARMSEIVTEKEQFYAVAQKIGLTYTQAEAVSDQVRQAILAERERCARVCEELWMIDGTYTAKEFAAAIRRG